MDGIPIVTLDKIYIEPNNIDIYFLDCTRVSGSNEIISRLDASLDLQIKRLSKILAGRKIVLADDVVFSGNVLKDIIYRFNKFGIEVVLVISSICTNNSYRYFNMNLKYGIKSNYILSDLVIDQVCERDFYFGIAGSGIVIRTNVGFCKAPYFKPYGNPIDRASVPLEYENYFSRGCLERSIYLWNNIDKFKKRNTVIGELPERIINTQRSEEVVKSLKKELKNL